MLNLDPGKLLVIGVVAIILLGPDRLPQVARQIGGAWRTFNEFRHRMESEVRDTMPDLPPTSEIARLARSPSALLNHLSNMASDEEPDGSFQPPDLHGENGTRGPWRTTRRGGRARGGRDRGWPRTPSTMRQAATTTPRRRRPAPRAPTPAPIHVERPTPGSPVVRRGRSRRPDAELSGATVVDDSLHGQTKEPPVPGQHDAGGAPRRAPPPGDHLRHRLRWSPPPSLSSPTSRS